MTAMAPDLTGPDVTNALGGLSKQSSKALIQSVLDSRGLGTLTNDIYTYLQSGVQDPNMLTQKLRTESQAYKDRFPGMDVMLKMGHNYNEGYYVNYETYAAGLEQQYGLPKGYLTDRNRITQLIENNVTASDLNARVQANAAAVMDAPQETRDALQRLYGVDAAGLTAYYLDPDNSLPYLQKQYAAASLAGQAAQQQIGVDRQTAERLAAQGLSEQQQAAAFAGVAAQHGLSAGANAVDQATLINAQFGDQAAQEAVTRLQRQRLAEFAGGGEAAGTTAGVVGLGSSGSR
jgi:hypothetical protein